MDNSRNRGARATQQDLYPTRIASILASTDDAALTFDPHLRRRDGSEVALIRRPGAACPKMSQKSKNMRQKGHRRRVALRDKHVSSGIVTDFGDNAFNGIVAFEQQCWRLERKTVDRN
jgi:hypothetical protein